MYTSYTCTRICTLVPIRKNDHCSSESNAGCIVCEYCVTAASIFYVSTSYALLLVFVPPCPSIGWIASHSHLREILEISANRTERIIRRAPEREMLLQKSKMIELAEIMYRFACAKAIPRSCLKIVRLISREKNVKNSLLASTRRR